jgi:hypothetical protein
VCAPVACHVDQSCQGNDLALLARLASENFFSSEATQGWLLRLAPAQ